MSANSVKLALQQALQAAFRQCEAVNVPLNDVQRQILQQVSQTVLLKALADPNATTLDENPLNALAEDQRQALLNYIAECDRNAQDWKTALFNDWLQGRHSGSVQFLRDRYGLDWINHLQPSHLAAYREQPNLPLQVGDHIEVSSRLWEWIPEEMGEEPEWIPCVITHLDETQDAEAIYLTGIVQFENGLTLDIVGLNAWNQNNWRRPKPSAP
jgi:hypothetical protein